MTFMVRDPRHALSQWQREMDQFFAPTLDDETQVVGSTWSPAVDIKEEEDRFVLHADIPGVRPEDIEITMDKGVLTIRGERKHESEESAEGYHRTERSHGVFMRRFGLPKNVDGDSIQATSKDGVLELVLPKAEAGVPHRIAVKH